MKRMFNKECKNIKKEIKKYKDDYKYLFDNICERIYNYEKMIYEYLDYHPSIDRYDYLKLINTVQDFIAENVHWMAALKMNSKIKQLHLADLSLYEKLKNENFEERFKLIHNNKKINCRLIHSLIQTDGTLYALMHPIDYSNSIKVEKILCYKYIKDKNEEEHLEYVDDADIRSAIIADYLNTLYEDEAKISEMDKLKDLLTAANIPYSTKDKNHDSNFVYPTEQVIIYGKDDERLCDCIFSSMSYGYEEGLLEIMDGLTEEEYVKNDVLGYLTAEEVFERFKYCYENNTSIYVKK